MKVSGFFRVQVQGLGPGFRSSRSIAVVNTERSYANLILQKSMDRIIDVFGKIKMNLFVNFFFFKHLNLRYDLYVS